MKLKRPIHLGDHGSDVHGVNRARARAIHKPPKLLAVGDVFTTWSVAWTKEFQDAHGIHAGHKEYGWVGQKTLDALAPYFDALAKSWYDSYVPPNTYVNPFRHTTGLVAERTDDGVDYGGDAHSRIDALGRSEILKAVTDSSWPGPYGSPSGFNGTGGLIHGVFLDGPNKGEEWYLAEFIWLFCGKGDVVQAGQKIAAFYHDARSGVGIETGFGVGGNSQVATEAGRCYARLLLSVGAPVRDKPGPGSTHSPFGKIR